MDSILSLEEDVLQLKRSSVGVWEEVFVKPEMVIVAPTGSTALVCISKVSVLIEKGHEVL